MFTMSSEVMWSILIASSVAMLLVLAAMPLLRRQLGAELAFALWLAVPLSCLLVLWPAPDAASWRASMQAMLPTVVGFASDAGGSGANPAFDASWRTLWIVGSVAFASLMVWQQWRVRRQLDLKDHGERHAGLIVLRAQRAEAGPLLLGAWRPRIVLPADFEQRHPPAERALILAHEAMHARRRDGMWSAVATLARCLFWFNPLVHVAAARFRRDQELACDAAVLRAHPGTQRCYAEAVLNTQLTAQHLPVGCHWQSRHPVKERILMIANATKITPNLSHRLALAATIAVLAVGTTLTSPSTRAAADDATTAPGYARLSPPVYPQALAEQGVEGTVLLRVEVDADGKPGKIVVDKDSPALPEALNEAAIAAVQNWTFQPATKDGKPVATSVLVPVKFALDPADETSSTETHKDALDTIQVGPGT
jgi:TonB family protein